MDGCSITDTYIKYAHWLLQTKQKEHAHPLVGKSFSALIMTSLDPENWYLLLIKVIATILPLN